MDSVPDQTQDLQGGFSDKIYGRIHGISLEKIHLEQEELQETE